MKPLEGITVLEFSTMITASFSAMMLAEHRRGEALGHAIAALRDGGPRKVVLNALMKIGIPGPVLRGIRRPDLP